MPRKVLRRRELGSAEQALAEHRELAREAEPGQLEPGRIEMDR